VTFIVQNVS